MVTESQSAPVQVFFSDVYEVDSVRLADSLLPFARWNEERIALTLPVDISYPPKVVARLQALTAYLSPGGWPGNVPRDAMQFVRDVVETVLPSADSEIIQGVRLLTAGAIRDDGSRASVLRDRMLSIFLTSKMLAIARSLKACMLIGEPPLDWGPEFNEMATVFSPRLIYGLSFIARQLGTWAGWTDADIWLGNHHYRVFAPICPEPNAEFEKDTPGQFLPLIVPQLVAGHRQTVPIRLLANLFHGAETALKRQLHYRCEVFVDSEKCSDHYDAKAYIERITADRILARLHQTPEEDRGYRFEIMLLGVQCSLDVGIRRRVREKLSFNV